MILRKNKIKEYNLPELYIHVGAGKTGSTAIQEFLFLNEKRLDKEGISVSDIGKEYFGSAIFHHTLAGQIGFDINTKKELISLWNKILRTEKEITLITSEIFHSLVNHKNGIEYFLWIKRLFSKFKVNIIYYIRREDEWLQSAYIEWVKLGNVSNGERISDIVKKKRVSLPEQVLVFAKIFGKDSIIVRPFEKEQLYGGNIFSDFLNIFGVELSDDYVLPEKNSNPSITSDALEFKRLYNTVCENRQEAKMLMKPLLSYSELVDSNSTKIFTKKNLLSKEERDYILEPLLPLYSKIAKEFLNRDDGILFYDLDTNCVSVNTVEEDNTKVIAYLLKELYLENIQMKREIELLKKKYK